MQELLDVQRRRRSEDEVVVEARLEPMRTRRSIGPLARVGELFRQSPSRQVPRYQPQADRLKSTLCKVAQRDRALKAQNLEIHGNGGYRGCRQKPPSIPPGMMTGDLLNQGGLPREVGSAVYIA